MGLFGGELSAREKIDVLRQTKVILTRGTNPDCVAGTCPPIRDAVSQALDDLGYRFRGVGNKREMSTTIEITRALGLKGGVACVETWADETHIEVVLAGLDTTIAHLK